MTLPLNEIFQTIQGEAYWTGTPSVFIRLQGCAVGCPWCDTKHTWAVEPDNERSLTEILAKTDRPQPTYAMVDVGDLVSFCLPRVRHVVITGGEPCDHDLTELTAKLADGGKQVQIETSGTAPIRCDPRTWVTLSPKIDMPGGKPILLGAANHANEIKMPVGKAADIVKLIAFLKWSKLSKVPMIWLQPLSQSRKATALCMRAASAHDWRISIQTHKYLNVR